MARIAGVDLPREKCVGVALTYIYGVGPTTAKQVLAAVGVDETIRVKNLTEEIEEKPLVEVSTSIDDNYVSDEEIKILIHKKINLIDSYEKLESVKFELEDRFGKITDDMYIYMHQEWLEKLARKLGINDVKQVRDVIEIYLSYDLTNSLNVQELFIKCSNFGRMFRFSIKNKRLLISLNTNNLDKHFIFYMIIPTDRQKNSLLTAKHLCRETSLSSSICM